MSSPFLQRLLIFTAAMLTVAGSTSNLLCWSGEPHAGKFAEVEDAEEDDREAETLRDHPQEFCSDASVFSVTHCAEPIDRPLILGQHHERGPPSPRI